LFINSTIIYKVNNKYLEPGTCNYEKQTILQYFMLIAKLPDPPWFWGRWWGRFALGFGTGKLKECSPNTIIPGCELCSGWSMSRFTSKHYTLNQKIE
jgi:hypothetical protein